MQRRMWTWIGLVLVLVLVGGGIAAGIAFGDHDHDYGYGAAQVVTTTGGETLVVRHGGPGFFPGFFLFPLFLFLIVGLIFAAFGRRRWASPGPWGGPTPGWLDEWHRRSHEGSSTSTAANDAGSPRDDGSA